MYNLVFYLHYPQKNVLESCKAVMGPYLENGNHWTFVVSTPTKHTFCFISEEVTTFLVLNVNERRVFISDSDNVTALDGVL